MSLIANGKSDLTSGKGNKSKNMAWSEPPAIEKLNWLIHIQHVRGEIATCKSLINDEIAKSNGRNEYAYYKQGIILREEGKIQEALESFQVCHKLHPENIENIKEIAKCLYLLRRYRLSLEAYFEAEKASTQSDWEIFHNIGLCLMRMGNSTKAREYTHKAVQFGKQEESYALLMKILIAENDFRSAVAVCNAAIEVCPDSIDMLTESGLLYIKIGQTQQAFERLSSALALDPTCSKALLGIGCITQSHDEYDVALSKYKLAVQTQPDSVALWNNIGMCFYSKQKYIAAITCLKRALWLSPLNARVLLNLGMVHLSTLQPASAFNFLCAAVNLRPDVGLSFMVLGHALLLLEDMDNALRATKQALELAPDHPIVLLNTSIVLYRSGVYNEAKQIFQQYQECMENDGDKEMVAMGQRLEIALAEENLDQTVTPSNSDVLEVQTVDENKSISTVQMGGGPENKGECDEIFGSDITEKVIKDLTITELGPDEA